MFITLPGYLSDLRLSPYTISRRFLRELDEAPGGNNLHYILQCLCVSASVTRVWTKKVHWMATECSRNDGSKTQYYIVILDRLQGRSGGLEWAPESWIRGFLTVDIVLYYKTHFERMLLTVSNLGKQSMILSYIWLKDHNPKVNWQTRKVQINHCPPQYKRCCVVRKEQVLRKKMEARAVNICWARPSPEYAEDSERDKNPQSCEVEYETGDRLFMTRLFLEPAAEDLHTTSTISQKLVERACRALEMQKGLLTLPDCAKGFKSVFAKEDFDILPEHR